MARNTNRQGAGFELDVMHYLSGCECETTNKVARHVGWRGFGYTTLRSSGSRGKVDVVAVGPHRELKTPLGLILTRGRTLWVQCKVTNPLISPAERRGVTDIASRAGGVALVSYRAQDIDTGRVRPHFRMLIGTGPKDWAPWEPGRDERS